MLTIAETHSGGNGVGVGAHSAGIKHLWGVEYRADIASVAEVNGFHTIIRRVEDVGLRQLEPPDILHASPVCKNASVAKAKRGEQQDDVDSGLAIVGYIRFLRPKIFTLENVWGYRKFEAFKVICDALTTLGYNWDVTHVNAADLGVPQTRKRLILRASRYGKKVLPPYPEPVRPWNGWYKAIEDLIPTLPESQFAPWQLKRLPKELFDSAIFNNQQSDNHKGGTYGLTGRVSGEPSVCITDSFVPKAFIASGALNDRSTSLSTRDGEHRMLTVTGSHNSRDIKAFLANESSTMEVRGENEPAASQVASVPNGSQRAFIYDPLPDGTQPMSNEERDNWENEQLRRAFIVNTREMHDYREENALTLRQGEEPVYAIPATSGVARHKAFLVRGGNAKSEGGITIDEDKPASTVDLSKLGRERAWLSCGRVVKMTTRALARFQSFPDSYILPANNTLACTVIGNAVAPLMYQRIIEGLADTL